MEQLPKQDIGPEMYWPGEWIYYAMT